MLAGTGAELPDLDTVVVASGPVPSGAQSWTGFLDRAGPTDRVAVERRCAELGPDDRSDILFTSGTTGTPKGVVMTHGRTLRVATDWVAMTGLGPDDRYLMVNPYFHMFGLKAGILACLVSGATMLPEPVFDVDRILERGRPGAGHGAAGAAHPVSVDPGPPPTGPVPAVLAAGGGDRCRRHPRRAGPPHPRRASLLDRCHGLRAHRGRHGVGHVAGGRPRDHRHHRRPAASRIRAADRGGGRRRTRRTVRRGAPAGRQCHGLLSRRPRGHGVDPLAGRVAAYRRCRHGRRCRIPAHRGAGQGHVHRRAGSTPTPPRSRTTCCAIPTSPRRR